MRKNRSFAILVAACAVVAAHGDVRAADPAAFAAECARRAAAAEADKKRAIPGDAKGWLFLTSELKHLGAGEFWNGANLAGDPAAAIASYQKSLAAIGVELVLMPVPAKAAIYPDKLQSDMPAAGGVFAAAPFFDKLRAAGVTVVDLEPVFQKARAQGKVYCEQDSHWSPLACRLAADEICALPTVQKLFAVENPVPRAGDEIAVAGDLAEALPGAVSGREQITVFKAAAQPVPPGDESPILLIGDSHSVVFSEAAGTIRHHSIGAGLRDHLQARLGTPLAVATNASSGGDGARALVARKAQSNPSFWDGKKLVIWCFAAREITKGPWRKIPARP